MSKINFKLFILIALIAIISLSCKKKTLDEAVPVVSTYSAMMKGNDSVIIIGKILQKGGDDIECEGFCYAKHPNPDIEENQILFNNNQTTFSAVVPVQHDSTYYFKTFAANKFGLQMGNILKFIVTHPKPPIVPCILKNNTFTNNGTDFPISNVFCGNSYAYSGTYGIEVDCYPYGESIHIDFNAVPTNGIYVNQSDVSYFSDSKNPKEVNIMIDNTYSIENGDSIYVSENPDHTLNVSFCKLNYSAFSSTFSARGKFSTK